MRLPFKTNLFAMVCACVGVIFHASRVEAGIISNHFSAYVGAEAGDYKVASSADNPLGVAQVGNIYIGSGTYLWSNARAAVTPGRISTMAESFRADSYTFGSNASASANGVIADAILLPAGTTDWVTLEVSFHADLIVSGNDFPAFTRGAGVALGLQLNEQLLGADRYLGAYAEPVAWLFSTATLHTYSSPGRDLEINSGGFELVEGTLAVDGVTHTLLADVHGTARLRIDASRLIGQDAFGFAIVMWTYTGGPGGYAMADGSNTVQITNVYDSNGVSLAGVATFDSGFQLAAATNAPEPTSAALWGLLGVGMIVAGRNRNKRRHCPNAPLLSKVPRPRLSSTRDALPAKFT